MLNIKRYLLIFFNLLVYCVLAAQPLPDSVKNVYTKATGAYARYECLYEYLESIRGDSSFIAKTGELKNYFINQHDEASSYYVEMSQLGNLSKTGNYTTSFNRGLELLDIFKQQQDDYGAMLALNHIGQALFYAGDLQQSLTYGKQKLFIAEKIQNIRELAFGYNNMASTYALMKNADSGIVYGQRAIFYSKKLKEPLAALTLTAALGSLAENYIVKGDYDSAILLAKQAMPTAVDPYNVTSLYGDIAESYAGNRKADSTAYYGGVTIALSLQRNYKDQLLRGYECLYKMYDQTGKFDSAYKYFKLAASTKDQLFSTQKANDIKAINLREQARQQQAAQEKTAFENRVRIYALITLVLVILIIALILLRNNKLSKKANAVLKQQKEEITNQKATVEHTLKELKAAQSQLIQSEKMASLGELTAGIAHEIQNPLNFVNNFSEVSNELVEELEAERLKVEGERDAALEDELLADIKQNLQKINHHGKRADAIVKGMLQHSRTSTGRKELTDINTLCDEYLRLAYHGLRAKDKSFNATLNTNFDESIGKVNVVLQDMGRVILNIITNAFYTVAEKGKKTANPEGLKKNLQGLGDYHPTVTVSTKQAGNNVIIIVADNGDGIPHAIKDKIFQPFFTTKPTGQGTGLGLSLAYDIVKAHGGEIKVETEEGEGTEFIITLPANKA